MDSSEAQNIQVRGIERHAYEGTREEKPALFHAWRWRDNKSIEQGDKDQRVAAR